MGAGKGCSPFVLSFFTGLAPALHIRVLPCFGVVGQNPHRIFFLHRKLAFQLTTFNLIRHNDEQISTRTASAPTPSCSETTFRLTFRLQLWLTFRRGRKNRRLPILLHRLPRALSRRRGQEKNRTRLHLRGYSYRRWVIKNIRPRRSRTRATEQPVPHPHHRCHPHSHRRHRPSRQRHRHRHRRHHGQHHRPPPTSRRRPCGILSLSQPQTQRRWRWRQWCRQPRDGVLPREPRRRKTTAAGAAAAAATVVIAVAVAAVAAITRAGVERGAMGAAAPSLPHKPRAKAVGWGRRGQSIRAGILTPTAAAAAVTPPFSRGCSRETPPTSRSRGPGSTPTQVSELCI